MTEECFWGKDTDVLISKEQMDYFKELVKQKEELKEWLEQEFKLAKYQFNYVQTMMAFNTKIPPKDYSDGKISIIKKVLELVGGKTQ